MNETHVQDYLAGEASRITVGLPPTGAIVADGRRGRRRAGLVTAGVTAAVVAFAAVGGALVLGGGDKDGSPLQPASSASSDPAAEGQWFGFDQIGLDVPATWDTTSANCVPGSAMQQMRGSDGADAGAPCAVAPTPGVVSIGYQRITAEDLEQITGVAPSSSPLRSVDGVEYRAGEVNCVDGTPQWCIAGIHVPDRDLNITVSAYDAQERLEAVVASVRVVPSLPDLPAPPAPSADDTTTHHLGVADVSVEVKGPWTFSGGTCGEPPVGRDVSLDEVSAGTQAPCTWMWTDGTATLMMMDGARTAERRQEFAADLAGLDQRATVDGLTFGYDDPTCSPKPAAGESGEDALCSWQAYVGERGLTINLTGVVGAEKSLRVLDSLRIVPADERS